VSQEILERCDASGRRLGPVPRDVCHGDPSCIHMTVHLHVFDGVRGLLLQKRSPAKDLYPGRWDTAVGGHVHAGETVWAALLREAREELDVDASPARLLYAYLHANEHESEYVSTFGMVRQGPFLFGAAEIDEVKFLAAPEITALFGSGELTPNFEDEFTRLVSSGAFPDGGGAGDPAPRA